MNLQFHPFAFSECNGHELLFKRDSEISCVSQGRRPACLAFLCCLSWEIWSSFDSRGYGNISLRYLDLNYRLAAHAVVRKYDSEGWALCCYAVISNIAGMTTSKINTIIILFFVSPSLYVKSIRKNYCIDSILHFSTVHKLHATLPTLHVCGVMRMRGDVAKTRKSYCSLRLSFVTQLVSCVS